MGRTPSRWALLAFTDDFPDGLAVAGTPNGSTTCGGTFAPAASATSLAFSGGRVGAGGTCTISVDVVASRAGALTGTSGDLTSDLPVNTSGASAALTVNEAPLSVSMSFVPATIDQGGVSRLTYRLDNGAVVAAAEVALSDRLPADVVLAPELNADNGCGGFLSATPGGVRVSYSGGLLGASATCTIAVDVTSAAHGSYPNDTESATSSLGTSTVAEATLTVDAPPPPGFAKTFLPATVDPGGISTLTYRIDNAANVFEVGSLAFTDDFPDGLAVAGTPNASTTCGGTFAPAEAETSLAFSGGRVAAGGTCTVSVDVLASRAGALTGTSGDLTSDLPDTAPGAAATLTVREAPLSVSMSFEPTAIRAGVVSRLTYRLDNGAVVAAADVALSDRLPGDVVLADPPDASTTCAGGTLTAVAGGSTFEYSDGSLGAGASCTIAVDVTSAAAGSHLNGTERVTSSLGTSTAASATLTVDPAAAPGFARVFLPDTIPQGGETEIVFTVDNGANAIAMTEMAFDDSLPSGVSVADTPAAGNSCGGTFSPVAGATTLAFTGGVLAAGATCELRVTVRALEAGTLTGREVVLTSSIATATAAEAMLEVDPAEVLGFAKAFSPDTVDPGGISTLTYRIDNTANLIEVGSLAFDDDFPDGLAVAGTPDASTTCGGTFAPAASATSLAFSGGRVGAGQTCAISVDVVACGPAR